MCNGIQIDYNDCITSVYRREIVSVIIKVAVSTNRDVTEYDEIVVGPFTSITTMYCNYIVRALDIEQDFSL
jgi:hypothetical protein